MPGLPTPVATRDPRRNPPRRAATPAILLTTLMVVCQPVISQPAATAGAAPRQDSAPCEPVRVAYTDRHAPPFYFGNGEQVPARPGAGVELIARMVASVGCPVRFIRVPVARIRVVLAEGSVDMAPLNATPTDSGIAAMPLDPQGKLDPHRSIEAVTYLFVRRADGLPDDLDTVAHFKGKRLGMIQGIAYAAQLRAEGYLVDAGATDLERNIDKLLMGRVDAYAATVTTPTDLDAVLRLRYGSKVQRLERPIRWSRTFLAASKQYYALHGARVDAMWQWVAAHGRSEMNALVRDYGQQP